MFAKETYIARRRRLAHDVGSGLLLFLGNDQAPMNYVDNTYAFRQDSTFLYFFGIDHEGLTAVIDIDEGRETIFGNDPTIDDIVWMGTQPSLQSKAERVGVSETLPADKVGDVLREAQRKGRTVHFLPPYRGEHRLKLQEWLGLTPAAQDSGVSVPFVRAVVNQRIYKSEEEVAEIDKAVDISIDMHVAMMRMVRPGIHEAEVRAAVTAIAQQGGGDNAFPVIATTHGQTLHNHGYIHRAQEGDMFLLDAGAEVGSHYCGDLSSTCPVGKEFTPRQRIIFDLCLQAHRAAVETIAPGVPFRDVHVRACTTIAEGMKALGLMKGDVDEAVRAGAHALFFPCGVGHMMGLDVHDMEDLGEVWVGYDGEPKSTLFGYKSLRLARPLEPGFVFTIEPGIYFIPELIDRWRAEGRHTEYLCFDEIDKWRDFGGLRNEEDYLVTPTGKRRLGTKYRPMSADEVREAREL
ncbi:MAG: aminopeptidase P family protein [Bacteroidaceae bacterium]|nr:aminopeptidase P family protein [Bacteroidaceae bacterium]